MDAALVNAFVLYFVGLLLAPNLPAGRLRRLLEVAYLPCMRLGLWHRWSMYAPEVPTSTRLALAGVVLDGRFVVVSLPGLADDQSFARARSLRYIAFQWALCSEITDYLKPALGAYALRLWRANAGPGLEPEAVEIRELSFPSAPPGEPERREPPSVRVLWSQPVEDVP